MNNSHVIIKHVMDHLFVAEERRLNGVIVMLVKENRRHCEDPQDSFMYSGQMYAPDNVRSQVFIPGRAKNVLHRSLHEEMEYYLTDKKLIMNDRAYIGQILFQLIHPCETLQHVRDALPDCVVDCAQQEIHQLLRHDGEAWTLRNNQRAMRQYEKFLPRLEVYSAARLLY